MQTSFIIKDKKLNTSILIKKNYISTFVKKIAKKNEKVFCIIDAKIKNKFNFRKEKNVKIITIHCGEKIKTINSYKNLAEKLIKSHGRILVRKSGTEPIIRVMGESTNKILLKKCIKKIKETIS